MGTGHRHDGAVLAVSFWHGGLRMGLGPACRGRIARSHSYRRGIVTRVALLAVVVLAFITATDSVAFLYHPEDRSGAVPVGEKGEPTPLPFEELRRRRLELRNAANPDWPLVALNPQTRQPLIDPKSKQPKLSDRGRLEHRIAVERKKSNRTQSQTVALAVDLLRFGRADEAAGVLREERRGYLPNVTLAHVAIAQDSRDRPGWSRAFTYLDIASEEQPPKSLPGMSPQQLAWELTLDRGPLMKLVRLRWNEAKGQKPPIEDELPDAIWPVKWVNDAGQYEPGKLAAAEKAKLPGGDFTEAIATVQQLVLWFPFDTRLYWLLGELYAGKGDFDAAKKIMDECVNTGHFSNRKVLMQHREAITKAAEAAAELSATPDGDTPPAVPFSFGAVWLYFGAVGLIALFAMVRAILKRRRNVP